MAITTIPVADVCRAARLAGRRMAALDTTAKDAALQAIAASLLEHGDVVLEANERDLQAARERRLSGSLLDRLALDEGRLGLMVSAVRDIAALPDPVGEVIDGHRLPNGLDLRKVRVPLGVVAVVYEARPNVTIDATALCLKSGNAIVLRGSSVAAQTNAVLTSLAADAAQSAGLPAGCVGLVAGGGHQELTELATQTDTVDLIIPRGGEGLKVALQEVATVPVIYAASGNCHVYVEATADLDAAQAIAVNAKVQRPGVCNAAETLLIHADIAERFTGPVVQALSEAGVRVRGDARTRALAGGLVEAAGEEDWDREYLDMTIAVGIVESTEQAITHINRHGSGHSEAIVTRDTMAARAFALGVDAACVYVNASTRFTDGGQFGMGAEIGNSTQKLHARGPLGLRELCTYRYLVDGAGHVRP